MDNTLGRGDPTERMDAAADDDNAAADERTREIRDGIEQTRVELTETIEAIQERLTPSHIVASATDRVKSAATEGVRHMAEMAGQTAQQAGDYTREATRDISRGLRQNPIPFALLGIGATWLLISSRDAAADNKWARRYGSERDGTESWAERERRMRGGRTQRDSTDAAGELASRTRQYASDTTDSMRRMARRRQHQFAHMVRENPLLVGVGALVLGVAFGMAVPETETENEYLGDARDNVMGRAREMARNVANQVQDAASGVADAADQFAGPSHS